MENNESSDPVTANLNDENLVDTNIHVEDKVDEPKVGMMFSSNDELYTFYLSYSKKIGFAICKRSCCKDEIGEVRYVTLTCACEGKTRRSSKKRINMAPISKTGCRARIAATLCPDGQWRITFVVLDHNHKTSPSKSRSYRCNRVIQPHVKRRLEVNDMAGIRMNKSFNSFVVESGGHANLTFQEKDCRNYIDKVRRLRLGEGDATAIHNYFLKMQADNLEFFYMMDFDDDFRVKNVFWADARSRAAFKEFGDVVTFDTTYLTNKYDMPFAPFVGVNHHGQSILLGCGLISNEDVKTFTWLFESWLACMNGIPPNGIITDQDKAMKKAIEIVFPNARHRWCLWHIMKKIPEKLGAYKDYETIKHYMKSAVYNSLTIAEFEDNWQKLIASYNLKENEWLKGLHDERNRWVPSFLKDFFWAGMSTTQRSESMNAFFDGYVNSKTSLKQFVEQYENALRTKVEKENDEDFKSFNSRIPCITGYEMEMQFQTEYTSTKFKEFQDELLGKINCNYSQCDVEGVGSIIEYEVGEDLCFGEKIRRTFYKGSFNMDNEDVECSCRLFQFRGILCRHALTVLIERRVYKISNKYILKRWSKLEKRSYSKVKVGYNGWSLKPESLRFDKMCKAFYPVADMAMKSDGISDEVIGWIDELSTKLAKRLDLNDNSIVNSGEKSTGNDIESRLMLSPIVVKRKGRPLTNRKKSTVEKIMKKRKIKTKDLMTTKDYANVEESQAKDTHDIGNSNASQEYGPLNLSFHTQDIHNSGHLTLLQGYGMPNMEFYSQRTPDSENANVFPRYKDYFKESGIRATVQRND